MMGRFNLYERQI